MSVLEYFYRGEVGLCLSGLISLILKTTAATVTDLQEPWRRSKTPRDPSKYLKDSELHSFESGTNTRLPASEVKLNFQDYLLKTKVKLGNVCRRGKTFKVKVCMTSRLFSANKHLISRQNTMKTVFWSVWKQKHHKIHSVLFLNVTH